MGEVTIETLSLPEFPGCVLSLFPQSGEVWRDSSGEGNNGVFMGYDSWANTGNLALAENAYALIMFNGKLYAGTYLGDVFVYDEIADTWANTGNLASATRVYSFTIFDNKLYAGTDASGDVFVYDEIADTWTNTGNLASATAVYSLAVFNNKLYAGTHPNGNVFVYDEIADTWANTGNLASAGRVYSLIVFNNKLYAGTNPNGDVFVYDEGADTWANTGNLTSAVSIYAFAVFNSKLYAGMYPNGDVFVYDEVANTWANTGNLASADRVYSLIVFDNKLYAGTIPNGDVFVYDEIADTWTNTGNLASAIRVQSLAVLSNKLYAGTYPNGDVFVYSPPSPYVPGDRFGRSVGFDGTDDYVDCGHGASLNITDVITIEIWIRYNTVAGYILAKNDGDNALNIQYGIYTPSSALNAYLNGSSHGTSGNDLVVDTWHHCVLVFDSTLPDKNSTFYIDGSLSGTPVDYPTALVSHLDRHLWLGRRHDSWYNDCSMGEIRIYNRALSASEIKELYDLGALYH